MKNIFVVLLLMISINVNAQQRYLGKTLKEAKKAIEEDINFNYLNEMYEQINDRGEKHTIYTHNYIDERHIRYISAIVLYPNYENIIYRARLVVIGKGKLDEFIKSLDGYHKLSRAFSPKYSWIDAENNVKYTLLHYPGLEKQLQDEVGCLEATWFTEK